jgi:predicted HTH transcriptional regulator
VLGSLNKYLQDTLAFIVERRKATARELTEAKKIEANTSGTRLLNLYKKRLVRRVGGEGAMWAYEAL